MLRIKTLLQNLSGLVGWRPADDPSLVYEQDEDRTHLYQSDSGLYFNDVSHLVRFEYLDKVRLEEEALELYIERLTQAAIVDTMDQYYRQRLRTSYGKTLLSPEPVISGAGYYRDLITGLNRFIGFRIQLEPYRSLAVHVSKVSLQLSEAQTVPLNLYLYQAGQAAPLATLALDYASANSVHWYNVKALNNDQEMYLNNDAGGTYYLGYYESDLDGYAIRKEFTGTLCQTCRSYFKEFNQYISVTPVTLAANQIGVDRDVIDGSLLAEGNTNGGLNLQLAVYCDLTSVLTTDRFLFAKAIQLKGAIKALNDMYTTPETSRLSLTEVKQDAYAEAQRLYPEYDAAINDIALEFTGLDSVCFPQQAGTIHVQHLAR